MKLFSPDQITNNQINVTSRLQSLWGIETPKSQWDVGNKTMFPLLKNPLYSTLLNKVTELYKTK